jgi:hypothetical protein
VGGREKSRVVVFASSGFCDGLSDMFWVGMKSELWEGKGNAMGSCRAILT